MRMKGGGEEVSSIEIAMMRFSFTSSLAFIGMCPLTNIIPTRCSLKMFHAINRPDRVFYYAANLLFAGERCSRTFSRPLRVKSSERLFIQCFCGGGEEGKKEDRISLSSFFALSN